MGERRSRTAYMQTMTIAATLPLSFTPLVLGMTAKLGFVFSE